MTGAADLDGEHDTDQIESILTETNWYSLIYPNPMSNPPR